MWQFENRGVLVRPCHCIRMSLLFKTFHSFRICYTLRVSLNKYTQRPSLKHIQGSSYIIHRYKSVSTLNVE